MSIRNLSGAPDLGGGNRRRTKTLDGAEISSSLSKTLSQLGSLTGSAPEHNRPRGRSIHIAGDLISSFQQKPRYISSSYNVTDEIPELSVLPPPPPPPPSSSSPRFLPRLRSSTWDASGMGRMSSPNLMSKSFSSDSPPSVGSTKSLTAIIDKEGDKLEETIQSLAFEDGEVGLYQMSDSENSEESKCEETPDKFGMDPVHEIIQGEHDLSPKSDAVSSLVRKDSSSTIKSDGGRGASVTFAEELTEYSDERESRPNIWRETLDDDEGDGTIDSPFAPYSTTGRNDKFDRFQRQTSEPSLLEKLNPFNKLSWSLIGSCIVRTAPCFWCSKKLGISATDREILLRLNRLCEFFCIVQIGAGIFLFVITVTGYVEDDSEELATEEGQDKPLVSPDLWNLEWFVYCLTMISVVLLIASILAQHHIRDVNLVGSVRFMWAFYWLLPVQIFFMIGLFDYFNVNEVKMKHWWDDPSMLKPREVYCEDGTANDECKVPIEGGIDYETEELWCQAYYKSDRCTEIRDSAQDKWIVTTRTFYTANGIWALLLVVVMWTSLNVLQAIITLPIVQRSKESNIPLWLTFPIAGCFIVGYFLHYSETSVTEE